MEHAASDTKTVLLHAALACFAEHGFDGTSMRQIADRARRPLSLLSHHFGSKEGLYQEVFKLIFERFILHARPGPIPEGGYAPRDRQEAVSLLREQIHSIYLEVVQASESLDPFREQATRLWLQEVQAPRPSLRPLLAQRLSPLMGTIQKCIQVLRPDLGEGEVAFLATSILGQVTGHGLMRGVNQVVWGALALPANAFQAAELLVDLCLHGLLGARTAEA